MVQKPLARCRACQLQLCKSRTQPPHGQLTQSDSDERLGRRVFTCQECNTVLVNSVDPALPGWKTQARPNALAS